MLRDAAVLKLRLRELRNRAKPLGLPDLCDFKSRVHLRDEVEERTFTPHSREGTFSLLTHEKYIMLRDAKALELRHRELSHHRMPVGLPDVCDFTSHPTEFTPWQRFSPLTPHWMLERDIMRRDAELPCDEGEKEYSQLCQSILLCVWT